MSWELKIERRGVLRDEELERFIEDKRKKEESFTILTRDINGETVRIKTKYRDYVIDSPKTIIDLYLETPKGDIFLIGCTYWFDVPYRLGEMRFNMREGWAKIWGTKNHPLEEFEDRLDHRLTGIREREEGVIRFGGNHVEYSGSFEYVIWSNELIDEIRGRIRSLSRFS